MTPDDLRAQAEQFAADADKLEAELRQAYDADVKRARQALDKGMERVRALRAAAKALGLTPSKRSSSLNGDMTGAQMRKRGEKIAGSRAKDTGDPLLVAIVVSKWKSLRRYALHLGVSPGTLINWRDGTTENPPAAQIARIERELGIRLPLK